MKLERIHVKIAVRITRSYFRRLPCKLRGCNHGFQKYGPLMQLGAMNGRRNFVRNFKESRILSHIFKRDFPYPMSLCISAWVINDDIIPQKRYP